MITTIITIIHNNREINSPNRPKELLSAAAEAAAEGISEPSPQKPKRGPLGLQGFIEFIGFRDLELKGSGSFKLKPFVVTLSGILQP